MKKTRACGAVLCLLAGLAACDTTQPLDSGTQTFAFEVRANATVELYDIWDVEVDTDGDGVPDTPASFKECRKAPVQPTSDDAPWNFSVQVSVLPAGTTEPTVVATAVGQADPFESLTFYSEATFGNPPIIPNNPPLFYTNPRRVSTGHRDYLSGCLGIQNLPEPNILGSPQPFTFDLDPGDTIIVEARKQVQVNSPFGFNSVPALSASATLDGRSVELQGNSTSPSTEDGGGFTFSFTVR